MAVAFGSNPITNAYVGTSQVSRMYLGQTLVWQQRPVVTSATLTITVGEAFSFQITAINGPHLSYGATGLPAGLSVNTSTGVISGTPTSEGTSSITISATNTGGTGAATLTLTVEAAVPDAPVITSSTTATATVGVAFSYQITASGSPTSFDATGLPTGLSVDTSTGLISGTPTTEEVVSVTLSATNAGGTGTATLSLTVQAAVPGAPTITSSTTATATVGVAFSYTITATNSPTSFSATGLPAGLSVDASIGVISGTPTTQGTSSISISATNAGGTGTATLSLTVQAAGVSATVATVVTMPSGTFQTFEVNDFGSDGGDIATSLVRDNSNFYFCHTNAQSQSEPFARLRVYQIPFTGVNPIPYAFIGNTGTPTSWGRFTRPMNFGIGVANVTPTPYRWADILFRRAGVMDLLNVDLDLFGIILMGARTSLGAIHPFSHLRGTPLCILNTPPWFTSYPESDYEPYRLHYYSQLDDAFGSAQIIAPLGAVRPPHQWPTIVGPEQRAQDILVEGGTVGGIQISGAYGFTLDNPVSPTATYFFKGLSNNTYSVYKYVFPTTPSNASLTLVATLAAGGMPTGLSYHAPSDSLFYCRSQQIFRVDASTGVSEVVAGAAGQSGDIDGAGGLARFSTPYTTGVDTSGNIWVVDQGNNKLRKITLT